MGGRTLGEFELVGAVMYIVKMKNPSPEFSSRS